MKRRILTALAALAALAAFTAPATITLASIALASSPATSQRLPVTRLAAHALILTTPVHICDVETPALCLRDPSDGGTGTTVVANTNGTSDSFDWTTPTITQRCNNGRVTDTCPFTSTYLDGLYEGKLIVNIKQEVSGGCVRFASVTSNGVIGTCDTGSEPSAAYVFDVLCSGNCNEYVNVKTTNDAVQMGGPGLVLSTNFNGNPVIVLNDEQGNNQLFIQT